MDNALPAFDETNGFCSFDRPQPETIINTQRDISTA